MSRVAENAGSVREVRIALVCYGGVSLAIYMHGVTRELHRLVVASSRFDEESVREGRFGASPVNHLNLLQVLGVVRPRARLLSQLAGEPTGEIPRRPGLDLKELR